MLPAYVGGFLESSWLKSRWCSVGCRYCCDLRDRSVGSSHVSFLVSLVLGQPDPTNADADTALAWWQVVKQPLFLSGNSTLSGLTRGTRSSMRGGAPFTLSRFRGSSKSWNHASLEVMEPHTPRKSWNRTSLEIMEPYMPRSHATIHPSKSWYLSVCAVVFFCAFTDHLK